MNINLKNIFKQIRQAPLAEPYLKTLKNDLSNYIKENPPVLNKEIKYNFATKLRLAPVYISIFIFLIVSGGLTAFSQTSLPGDILYPIKLASENIPLILANPETKTKIHLALAQKRINEMQRTSNNQNLDIAFLNLDEHLNMAKGKISDISLNQKLSNIDNQYRQINKQIAANTTKNINPSVAASPPALSVDIKTTGNKKKKESLEQPIPSISAAPSLPPFKICDQKLCGKIQCLFPNTESEGWYQIYEKEQNLIVLNPCSLCEIKCDSINTKSEGWYSFCPNENVKLIKYDLCSTP